MASSWKITRGIKTNRVRRGRNPDKSAGDRGRRRDLDGKKKGVRREYETSPQRAVIRQRSQGAKDLWCQISISIRAEDLRAIDDLADVLHLSRSAFLVQSGLGLIKRLR